MQTKYTDRIADMNFTIKLMAGALVLMFMTTMGAGAGWYHAPKTMTVHIPPDLSAGTSLRPGAVDKSAVYLFALYVWRQLNRWEDNGGKNYLAQINGWRDYLTPSCYHTMIADHVSKHGSNELNGRVRGMDEIPGRGFAENRIAINSPTSWTVMLDLHIVETMHGNTVKNAFIQYPLEVVRHNVDPAKNQFGLAINCLIDDVQPIEVIQ